MSGLAALVLPAAVVSYLVNLALAGSLACGAGLMAARICRRRTAPLRHGILLWTLLLLLLSPAAVWLAERNGLAVVRLDISTLPAGSAAGLAKETIPGIADAAASPSAAGFPALDWPPRMPAHGRMGMPSELEFSDRPGAAVPTTSPVSAAVSAASPSAMGESLRWLPERSRRWAWWQAIGASAALLWATGSAVALVRLGWGYLALARFCRRLALLLDPAPQKLARQAAPAVGLRTAPPLFLSRWVGVPVSIGLIKPAIVLPEAMAQDSDAEELQAVLLHETAHIARRDHWVGLGQRLSAVLFWWNPLVYRVGHEIAELREEICDNHVVLVHGEGRRLARLLVDMAARAAIRPLPASTVGVLEPRLAGLTRRVARLLDRERNVETRMNLRSRVVVCLMGLAALTGMASIGGLRLAQAQPAIGAQLNAAVPPAPSSPRNPSETRSSTRVAEIPKAAESGPQSAGAGVRAATRSGERTGGRAGNQGAGDRPSGRLEFRGQVVDPDGKPFPGAKLYLLYYTSAELPPPSLRATSGPDGSFRFTMAKSEFHARGEANPPWVGSVVVAVGNGWGIGWEGRTYLDAIGQIAESLKSFFAATVRNEKRMPVIHLARDDVPITGRIVDANGRAVAGAMVRVLEIQTSFKNDLTGWLNAIEKEKADYYQAGRHLENGLTGWLRNQLPYLLPAATTDRDGRFRLFGIGRERIVCLQLEGPGIVTQRLYARTRPGPTLHVEQQANFPGRLAPVIYYGATFEHAARPSRPLAGLVRDVETRQPLAGVTIQAEKLDGEDMVGSSDFIRATTDGNGRYRLTGFPIGKGNELLAVPPLDGPYLLSKKPADTRPGRGTIEIDFELQRGIRVQGRVTDAATGKPVSAQIDYYVFNDNSRHGAAPGFRGFSYGNFGNFYQTDEEGRFKIPVLPGRGIVAVKAHDHEHYPRGAGAEKIEGADRRWGIAVYKTDPTWCAATDFHALAEVNPPEGAKELDVRIVLDPHQQIHGTVQDPLGQPLAEAAFSGRNEFPQWEPLFSENFTVEGYQPDKPRTLLFVQHPHKLSGSLVLKGPQLRLLGIRLEPWGEVTGHLVDPQGKAQPNVLLMDGGQKLPPQNVANHMPGASYVRSDQEGRFHILGLAPSISYEIDAIQDFATPTPVGGPRMFVRVASDIVVRSGETKDLGNLTLKPPKPPGGSTKKAKSPTAPSSGAQGNNRKPILEIGFRGNTLVSEARLRAQVTIKPDFSVDLNYLHDKALDAVAKKRTDEDIARLTAYYLGLGFFRVRIGREIARSGNGVNLTFVIEEGPRYTVRNVNFVGNTKYTAGQLREMLTLKGGQFFDLAQMEADKKAIQEKYHGIGYPSATVEPDPRFVEEPGLLDLLYTIREGDRRFVGQTVIKPAAAVLAQGARAASKPSTVHIVAKMRIPPGDYFESIDADGAMVPVEVWRDFAGRSKWRMEKSDMVEVMEEDTSSTLFEPPKRAWKYARHDDVNPRDLLLLRLTEVRGLLYRELLSALANSWAFSLTHQTTAAGEKKLLVTVEAKRGWPENNYAKNQFFDSSDMRRVYRFDAKTQRLEGLDAYLHRSGGDVLVLTVERIEYDQPIDPALFVLTLPQDVQLVDWRKEYKEPQRLPDNKKYEKMTPKEAARAFFEACARKDWDEVQKFEITTLDEGYKQRWGGLEIVHLGEPFKTSRYYGWFIPYEVKLKNGRVRKWNLAMRNDNQAHRYVEDGGV